MQDLIKRLSEPYIAADGTSIGPTNTARQAAKVLNQLLPVMQQDRAGRLKAEAENADLLKELTQLRSNITLEGAISAYKEACNAEYDS